MAWSSWFKSDRSSRSGSRNEALARRSGRAERFGTPDLERLEDRTHLTADLGVAWDEDRLELPSRIVPGDRIIAPILVVNNGPMAAVGNVTINFYLSTDTVLNTSNDKLLRSYDREPIQLPVFNGDPDDLGEFDGDLTIPGDVLPGTYHLIVRIIPTNALGDFNSSNNIAVSAETWQVVYRFGSFDQRTNVSLKLNDPEGTLVTFAMNGGGFGEVVQTPDGFGVTFTGSGNNSNASVTTSGGDGRFDFTSITINGSLGSLSAAAGRLRGALTATTGMGSITLGDVIGGPTGRTIVVPATSISPSFRFAAITDLSIQSAVPITLVSATSWTDTGGATGVDLISAPSLVELKTTGNFNASLALSGEGVLFTSTLTRVSIGGVIKGGTWSISGSVDSISAFATTVGWSISTRFLSELSIGQTLRGVIAASGIGTITVGKDILASRILAGADLGADARLGGAGANADTFSGGTITTLSVVRNVANSIIGAGLDPTDGIFNNGNDRIRNGTASRITTITIGNVAGMTARFLANRYTTVTIGGNPVDWTTSSRFVLSTTGPAVTVENTTVAADGVTVTIRFDSTNLIDLTTIGSMSVRIVGLGAGGIDQLMTLNSRAFVSGSNQGSGRAVFRFSPAGGAWPVPAETYEIRVVQPGGVEDIRNNAAPAGTVGSFMV